MRKIYTLQDHLKESLKDPQFKKTWEESEVEYQLSRQIINQRLNKKMSQGELAKKAKTTQAVISRVENMLANPSLNLLKRLAGAFNVRLRLSFE